VSFRVRWIALVLLALPMLGCAGQRGAPRIDLDAVGERYVRLALAMPRYDRDFVDSFYGPPEWQQQAERDSIPLATIARGADSLASALGAASMADEDTLTQLRHRYLQRQLQAMASRARLVSGAHMTFDEESQALYDVVAPQRSDTSFVPVLARLDSLLPGTGTISERYEALRRRFFIPRDKLDTVFATAIAEARRRTRAHMTLPDSESFHVEFVTGKTWGGYNWYQGRYHSLIQVNTDLPSAIDRALDLACHEGYPGHHVYNVLIERALVRERGWKEFTLFPLYSPIAMIAEGTAVVAPDVAFPGAERHRFDKEVLCPLAGIDTTLYDRYAQADDALRELSMAGVEGARRWLDGRMTRDQARDWLVRYAARTPERAAKDLTFAEQYRSYVVNYRMGRLLVLDWLAANGGDAAHPERRWQLYQTLLASPRLPSDLGQPL